MKFIDGIVSNEKMMECTYAHCNWCNKYKILYSMVVNEETDLAYCNETHMKMDIKINQNS